MPAVARFRASEGHLVICGDDKLAYRLAQELTSRYRERVTVILFRPPVNITIENTQDQVYRTGGPRALPSGQVTCGSLVPQVIDKGTRHGCSRSA